MRLNAKELRVLRALSLSTTEVATHATVAAAAFPATNLAKAKSWVRNAMRKLTAAHLAVRTDPGCVALELLKMPDIGDRIRHARQAATMSQNALAVALAVKRGRVAHWEQGRSRPALTNILDIAEATSSDVLWLINGSAPS